MAPGGADATVLGTDGIELAVRSIPGSDPPPGLLLLHATGFCKEVWDPVVEELSERRFTPPMLSIDQRGHGDSESPSPPFGWEALGRDVAAVVDRRSGSWIGVGHSSGGAALAMAEIERPGFVGLVLIEPIVYPGPHERIEHGPMSIAALRRRDGFASPDAAYDNFSGKGPFARWDDRALRAYVSGCLRRTGPDEWRLKCPPASEAEFYREGSNHDTWERLGGVGCPVLVIAGAESNSHPGSFVSLLTDQFPDARSVTVAGATHFVPMEQPGTLADLIVEFAQGLDGGDH